MNDPDRAIVRPIKGKNSPELCDFSVMAAPGPDLNRIRDFLNVNECNKKQFYNGVLYYGRLFSLVGPMIGAPYAVMILETLLAWGAKKILFYGWCGSISKELEIGTVLIPTTAFVDEGTSRNYGVRSGASVKPSPVITGIVRETFKSREIPFMEGGVWTTDAIYRETARKVDFYREKGAVAVEMELSALFTVGKFHNAEVGAFLIVSDDLSDYSWKPGFRRPSFKKARMQACETIREICSHYDR